MEAEDILKELKNKVYHPLYFLHGEEPYFIDQIADYVAAHVLDDAEKEFNQTILYGKDTDVHTLISYARRYPMMSNYQVIIVKEAQDVKKIEELLPYVEKPVPTTILVLCFKYKKLDGRTAFAKVLKKSVCFESKKIYDNKVPDWIAGYLSKKGYRISPKASVMLVEYLGNELGKIVNELDKLLINIPEATEINEKQIEENIGISKDYNTFELHAALGKKDVLKANRIINYFAENTKSNPMVVTISSLYSYFSKLLVYHSLTDKSKNNVASVLQVHPFFVSQYESAARLYPSSKLVSIIGYLREYDLRSKGVGDAGTGEGDLLRELVYKILH